jgi:valyl-tRNA synthetase
MITNWVQKHQLEVVDILNDDGTLSEAAQVFVGEERFEARKKVVQRLEDELFLEKVEDYTSEVGFSERTDTVVEPPFEHAMVAENEGPQRPGTEICDG